MSQPPLSPPPFDQSPMIRQCIRTTVRIKNHDLQEVNILTTVMVSVESRLTHDHDTTEQYSSQHADDQEDESMTLSDDDIETSSEDFSEDETETGRLDSAAAPQCNNQSKERFNMKAFWFRQEPIREVHHGIWTTIVYHARVLHKSDLHWIATNEEVAIKSISWRAIRASRNRISEDFIKEISALQYMSQWQALELPGRTMHDTHVMTVDTVMCNESHLFLVMPFCRGGDLCQRVAESESERFTEDRSRFWFRQILKGLETLQRSRICHRDLSPENLLIIDDTSLIIDFGMCLRIPYNDNGLMHLISPQTTCGKLPHMAPEIYRKRPFNGQAVDIWSAGTVLLFMLTGKRFSSPPLIDRIFDIIALDVSDEATDLLRKMFRLDPDDRLTLQEILQHPFVNS